CARGAGAYW
nr:immunoglobulin heavy chain junction region [Mus musculus]NSM03951.1 immunoglobulin heavy chain junction region [Mus musculus]NSM03961.1 immunoglobulin heavy chain junction region [Mus musculus]NSM04149.1 immunoglobulin heavy chain junction region [Mus musculus]NSM04230.1 immunoglobulin heavy chain junction region [Mus musculus]